MDESARIDLTGDDFDLIRSELRLALATIERAASQQPVDPQALRERRDRVRELLIRLDRRLTY